MTSPTGQISSLTTLPEPTHRRLLSISTQLVSSLPSYGGLNVKAHRLPGAGRHVNVGVDAAAGRSAAVVDGELLARWTELGSTRRAEISGRGGYEGVGDMRAELEGVLGWSGLSYF